jgi:hypothetical protein
MNGIELLPWHRSFLVIVGDLDIEYVSITPEKADPKLIVDPDAVLSCAVPTQPLESIGGRDTQVSESLCAIQHSEFAQGRPM